MKRLKEILRGTHDNKGGAVIQIVAVIVAVFALMALMSFMFFLFNKLNWIETKWIYLSLPSNFSDLVYRPWTILSFQFVHSFSNPFHIVFNLLWLYWFGRMFNFYFGNTRVWFLYLTGGICGGLLFMISYEIFPVFQGQQAQLVGASAGVTAIVIAVATYLPNLDVYTLLGSIKMKWIAVITLLLDFSMVPNNNNAGGHISHIGGAILGFVFMKLYQKGTDISEPFVKLFKKKEPSVPQMKIITVKEKGKKTVEKPSQQEIDRILDKIASQGYDNLTKEEKQTLYNASGE